MRIVYTLLLLPILALVAGACSSNKAMRDVPDLPSCMPEWYLETPQDQDYLLVSTSATSRDLQMSVDKATQAGRAEISSIFDNRMKRLVEQLRKETGKAEEPSYRVMMNDISKSVVSDILLGSRVRQQKICTEGAVYRAFVLVEMPLADANEALITHIRARENGHTELGSSEAFKDLEDEVKAYEEWRRSGANQTSKPPDTTTSPEVRPFERRRR